MPDPLQIFATNLKRIRKDRAFTQESLALAAGVNVSNLGKIERREREPRVLTVSKLAIALRISAAELFEGIDGREDVRRGGGQSPPSPT